MERFELLKQVLKKKVTYEETIIGRVYPLDVSIPKEYAELLLKGRTLEPKESLDITELVYLLVLDETIECKPPSLWERIKWLFRKNSEFDVEYYQGVTTKVEHLLRGHESHLRGLIGKDICFYPAEKDGGELFSLKLARGEGGMYTLESTMSFKVLKEKTDEQTKTMG